MIPVPQSVCKGASYKSAILSGPVIYPAQECINSKTEFTHMYIDTYTEKSSTTFCGNNAQIS